MRIYMEKNPNIIENNSLLPQLPSEEEKETFAAFGLQINVFSRPICVACDFI